MITSYIIEASKEPPPTGNLIFQMYKWKKCKLISFGLLFSQSEIDTTKKLPVFDLSKGFNIPGIIPKNMPLTNQFVLLPHEIEAIKQNAMDYQPGAVTNDDIVVLETNRGTMKLKLFPNVAPKHCKKHIF